MISNLFHLFFYNPIYNTIVLLIHIIPGGDVGVAVIIITILTRIILLPFSISAARTQHAMGTIEPKLKEIREKHKDDKEKQAKKTMEVYREAQINPFSSIITTFLQIPILLALYMVFRYEAFPLIDTHLLYSFITAPINVSTHFLGLINVSNKSIVLAVLAGITQYVQATFMIARTDLNKTSHKPGDAKKTDFTKMLNTQMRYMFPFIIAIVAYTTSGAIALYFATTNAFGALQEVYLRRKLMQQSDTVNDNKEK